MKNREVKMIKQIGTKIYYCNITGNVIKIIGDMMGYVKETTFRSVILVLPPLHSKSLILFILKG